MKARQSENARALFSALGSVKRVNFFLKQMLAQVDQNGKPDPLSRENVSSYKRGRKEAFGWTVRNLVVYVTTQGCVFEIKFNKRQVIQPFVVMSLTVFPCLSDCSLT